MWSEVFRKWFGLNPVVCNTCEVLRSQLDESNRERRELLHKLLDKEKAEPLPKDESEPVPIQPQFIPWRVRQQMLEAEDRKKAQLMRDKKDEIEKLEEELGVKNVSQKSASI